MQIPDSSRTARSLPSLLLLCILLWLAGLLFAVVGALLLARGEPPTAALALLLGAGLAAAGLGLYRLRRWGVILFGALAMLGSVSYLAGALNRHSTLTSADPAAALGALFSILTAILIPFGLIYVTLVLWRQLR